MSTPTQAHAHRGGRGGGVSAPSGARKRKAANQIGGGGRLNKGGPSVQSQQSSTQQAARRAMDSADQRSWPHMPIVGPNQLPTAGSTMKKGYAINDYYADSAVDELDRLTPRDIAAARYKRNHDLLEMVFDPLPITELVPPPSYYASQSKEELEKRLESIRAATEESKVAHHATVDRIKRTFSSLAEVTSGAVVGAALDDEDVEEVPVEEWARNPSKGRIIGVGIVRAVTPPEIRARFQLEETERRKVAAAAAAVNAEAERVRREEEIAAVSRINPTIPHSMDQPFPPAPESQVQSASEDAHMEDGTVTAATSGAPEEPNAVAPDSEAAPAAVPLAVDNPSISDVAASEVMPPPITEVATAPSQETSADTASSSIPPPATEASVDVPAPTIANIAIGAHLSSDSSQLSEVPTDVSTSGDGVGVASEALVGAAAVEKGTGDSKDQEVVEGVGAEGVKEVVQERIAHDAQEAEAQPLT